MSLKIGLIGAGRWAGVHRDALLKVGAELAGVAVSRAESKARVEQAWSVPATTELVEFLSWDMDAVIVASPNYLHAEHSIAALEAGKHVLVEKPMALTVADCDAMTMAAQQVDKVLAVGLEMRVFTLFERVKQLVDKGEIGAPLHLKLDLWRRPYRAGSGGWKSDPAKLGSAILEEPIHYLDLARWYFAEQGEPETLQAWANSRPRREQLNENLDIRLTFQQGAYALVTRSIAAYRHRVNLQLVGEAGALHALWQGTQDTDAEPQVSLTLHHEQGTQDLDVTPHTGHAHDVHRQTSAFIKAIQTGEKPPADAYDGRASVALCLAAERSLEEGSSLLTLGAQP